MKSILTEKQGLFLLRILMPIFMLIHGITRTAQGSVNGFGEYIDTLHIGNGHLIAWTLTSIEVIGSIFLIAGYFVPIISFLLAMELIVGIYLVHFANGWFVVGGGTGGVEYSALLIVCYIILFLSHPLKIPFVRQK